MRTLPDGSRFFFDQEIAAKRGWKHGSTARAPVLTFDNGERIPELAPGALGEIADGLLHPLAWKGADVAIVDDHRVMHGRRPYAGARRRRVVVCLVREPDRIEQHR